ncbi:41 kDa spicule matrix protein-like [Chrysemys picta bellii]|uniref:41 kDa spicule matrix protein-like n=1 Tax=Chrysemys picta bellii TaxID=8478 RepID=UPI0032B2F4DE
MQMNSLARVLLLSLLLLERARAAPLWAWPYGSNYYYNPQNMALGQAGLWQPGGQQNPGGQPGFGFNLGLNPFDLGIKVPGFGFNLGLGGPQNQGAQGGQQNQGAQGGQQNPGGKDPFNLGINVGGPQKPGDLPGFGFNLGLGGQQNQGAQDPFNLGINVSLLSHS